MGLRYLGFYYYFFLQYIGAKAHDMAIIATKKLFNYVMALIKLFLKGPWEEELIYVTSKSSFFSFHDDFVLCFHRKWITLSMLAGDRLSFFQITSETLNGGDSVC